MDSQFEEIEKLRKEIKRLKEEKEELSIRNTTLKVGIMNRDHMLAKYDDYVRNLQKESEKHKKKRQRRWHHE